MALKLETICLEFMVTITDVHKGIRYISNDIIVHSIYSYNTQVCCVHVVDK